MACIIYFLIVLVPILGWIAFLHLFPDYFKNREKRQIGFGANRVIATVFLLLIIYVLRPGNNPFLALLLILPLSLLVMLWAGPLMDYIGAKAIAQVTGHGEEVEPQPLYSIVETQRRSGKPQKALDLLDAELEKFPADYEGLILKAMIQMEDLKNFQDAQATLLQVGSAEVHTPGQVSRAHNLLADWQIKFEQDESSARETLEMLRARFPDSGVEFAVSQRLARLDCTFDFDDKRDAAEVVSDCLKQLEKHPLDNNTREKLAEVYFERYNKPDLAWEEMYKLFAMPYQQPADLCRWLNRMADWHLKRDHPDGARQCLQQIISRFPDQPQCEVAQLRLTRLQL